MYFILVVKLKPQKFSNSFFSAKHWAIKVILTYLESKKIDKYFRLKRIAINWIFVFYPSHRVISPKLWIHFSPSNIEQSVRYLHIWRAKKSTNLIGIRIHWYQYKNWAINAKLTHLVSKKFDKYVRLKMSVSRKVSPPQNNNLTINWSNN